MPTPPPVNDLCCGALILAQGVAATGDNPFATNDVVASPTCGSGTSGFYKGVWYRATPTTSGNLTITSCGSSFDPYLRVFVTTETTDIDMSALANGIYILKYLDASHTQMIKVSKQ